MADRTIKRASTVASYLILAAYLLAGCAQAPQSSPVPASAVPIDLAQSATALPPVATTERSAQSSRPSLVPAGASISSFCLRPDSRDVLFGLRPSRLPDQTGGDAPFLMVYRSTFDPDGTFTPVTLFADLSERYDPSEAWIERIQCHRATGRVLVTVGNQWRMEVSVSWRAELWLIEADGQLAFDHALARDLQPANAVWSPDGGRLLLEGSPMGHAGQVFVYDLASASAERLEGVSVETVAGAGGGWLHWGSDGKSAILESIVLTTDGAGAHSMDVVDPLNARAPLIGSREILNVVAPAMDPSGGMIVVTESPGSPSPPHLLEAFRWDPANPSGELVALGGLAASYHTRNAVVRDLALLPPFSEGAAGPQLVFITHLDDDHTPSLALADMKADDKADVWRLSPRGSWVEAFEIAGDWLAYQVSSDPLGSPESSEDPFDMAAHFRVIPLSQLDPSQLSTNPAFQRPELP